ncbi:hypothetical protein NEF87_001266 [Candidatus Lokiarchaeum ossiferum]|uniref:HNH nuclease domain-containing protein n=1 Tax=Candidatus Lokiarchaeum ossiferum TaxID=2951803 RepID=A0ABY6HN93_9ARCH|nr:hypothetical protein NEF87_001266 [Candidatus Lokiarchaeum sp. B-35]
MGLRNWIQNFHRSSGITMVVCSLETDRHYQPKQNKHAYAAFLVYDPWLRTYKRFFIKHSPRLWDAKHKTYWISFEFSALVGSIVEFRGQHHRNISKTYYRVSKRKKTHLQKISSQKAYHLALKFAKSTSQKEYISTGRDIPAYVRLCVWKRDQGRCVVCGASENIEYDHIIPYSRGGTSTVDNIQILCLACNRRKSNRMVVPSKKSDITPLQ